MPKKERLEKIQLDEYNLYLMLKDKFEPDYMKNYIEELKEKIVEISYTPEFGARQMQRVIQDKVGNPLAYALLSGEVKRGDSVEVDPENFEIIINGIHSPGIYNVEQIGNDVVVTFKERLFSYDGLQKENVIIIGKLLDIALLTEQLSNTIVITDENDERTLLLLRGNG